MAKKDKRLEGLKISLVRKIDQCSEDKAREILSERVRAHKASMASGMQVSRSLRW